MEIVDYILHLSYCPLSGQSPFSRFVQVCQSDEFTNGDRKRRQCSQCYKSRSSSIKRKRPKSAIQIPVLKYDLIIHLVVTRICQEDEESGESKSSKFPRCAKSRIFKTYPVKTFEVQFSGFSHRSLGPFLYVLKVTWLTYKLATLGRNTIFFYESKSKLDFVNLNTCTSVLNAQNSDRLKPFLARAFSGSKLEIQTADLWTPCDLRTKIFSISSFIFCWHFVKGSRRAGVTIFLLLEERANRLISNSWFIQSSQKSLFARMYRLELYKKKSEIIKTTPNFTKM